MDKRLQDIKEDKTTASIYRYKGNGVTLESAYMKGKRITELWNQIDKAIRKLYRGDSIQG